MNIVFDEPCFLDEKFKMRDCCVFVCVCFCGFFYELFVGGLFGWGEFSVEYLGDKYEEVCECVRETHT